MTSRRFRVVRYGKQPALEVTLRCAALLIFFLAAAATSTAAQTASAKSGAELYTAACAACHGADGRGTTPTLLGFATPIPDFTDCSFSTVEPDEDWMAVSHDGVQPGGSIGGCRRSAMQ